MSTALFLPASCTYCYVGPGQELLLREHSFFHLESVECTYFIDDIWCVGRIRKSSVNE